jgi:folate-dependent phosphoribosylglycinamide formyltransferase PurN
MQEQPADLGRPVRVVLFTGGPSLDRAAATLACMLDEHPDVQFLAGFCESPRQGFWATVQDLWRRRGVIALPLLLVRGVGAAARFITGPRAERALRARIARISGRIRFVPDIHSPQVLDEVRSLDPDLGLIYGGPILKPALFEIPRLGTLGIHHGKVPEYRGKKTTFWAVFNNEPVAGVTIQRVNARIDAGEIVDQGTVVVGRKSLGRVERELEQLGFELYVSAVVSFKAGKARPRPQQGKTGALYRDPGIADIIRFQLRQVRRRLGGVS